MLFRSNKKKNNYNLIIKRKISTSYENGPEPPPFDGKPIIAAAIVCGSLYKFAYYNKR